LSSAAQARPAAKPSGSKAASLPPPSKPWPTAVPGRQQMPSRQQSMANPCRRRDPQLPTRSAHLPAVHLPIATRRPTVEYLVGDRWALGVKQEHPRAVHLLMATAGHLVAEPGQRAARLGWPRRPGRSPSAREV
jgi:hypothetical protein